MQLLLAPALWSSLQASRINEFDFARDDQTANVQARVAHGSRSATVDDDREPVPVRLTYRVHAACRYLRRHATQSEQMISAMGDQDHRLLLKHPCPAGEPEAGKRRQHCLL